MATINPEELAICKRRGHDSGHLPLHNGWVQCKWCGIWLREVRTLEEREDTPPESEQSTWAKSGRLGRTLVT